MKMIKHVGKHSDQKVVTVFREVPNEDHMCLVIYPDQLPTAYHDDLMKCIESNAGQASSHLGEAMQRVVGTDGRNLLAAAHSQRWMKKVRCQDVIMTPVPSKPGARLDEINTIIKEMESGADAAKRLAQIDAQSGIADPAKTLSDTAYAASTNAAASTAVSGVLSDADIAKDLLKQADGFKLQMEGIQKEISRLTEEAISMDPSLAPKKKRGRPAKASA